MIVNLFFFLLWMNFTDDVNGKNISLSIMAIIVMRFATCIIQHKKIQSINIMLKLRESERT